MYKFIIYINLLFVTLVVSDHSEKELKPVTEAMTVCHTGPGEMLAFFDDPAFVAFHSSPLPFDFQGMGEMVSFPASDGKDAGGYLLKAKEESDQWLFVYQEWWGLNDNIKEESEKFYDDLGGRVNVLALDLYDGNLATNPQEAMALVREVREERLENIIIAGKEFAGKDAEIANVGWCFGGSWSLKSALLLGDQNIGSIIYYGMPVRDVEKLKTLNSDVLGIFATEQNISKEVIEEFALAMKTAGKKLDYKIFDAVHGFANPSNAKHDPAATREAYDMSIDYLKGKFD